VYREFPPCELGQFNLIDRLSSPPAPQKLARPNFFYFAKITFSGKFWCPTLAFIFPILIQVRNVKNTYKEQLNNTPFVDKHEIVINSFSLRK
jgi:hypothetical protein